MEPARTERGASAEAIQHHYDLGNEFYRRWLDPEMVYSGAMWCEGDDLASAQVRKIEHHIAESHAAGAGRVLDIGCGWGAVLRRLVGHHDVEQVVGLTLSEAQADWIRRRPDPRVDVRVESWADHAPEATYDAIISIGAFEHFARIEQSEAEKTEGYRAFFRTCKDWLGPRGRLSLQTFAYGSARPRAEAVRASSTQFLAREIFPETDPPRLANIAEAIEGHFEIVALRNDRADYARTCTVWLENMHRCRDELVARMGEETTARYERYLGYSLLGFRTGNLDLYRITLERVSSGTRRGGA